MGEGLQGGLEIDRDSVTAGAQGADAWSSGEAEAQGGGREPLPTFSREELVRGRVPRLASREAAVGLPKRRF